MKSTPAKLNDSLSAGAIKLSWPLCQGVFTDRFIFKSKFRGEIQVKFWFLNNMVIEEVAER